MAHYMFDAAYSPNLATCRSRGGIAVSHYMTRSYASTSPQPHAIRDHGMGVVFNWEGWADELKGASRAKGKAVGREALNALPAGVPRNGTVKIYYSVDCDLTNLAGADEAFRGINDAHKGSGVQVGVYGEGGLIERLHKLGLVTGGQWLSMSEGFGGFTHAMHSGLVAVVQMHDANGNWIGTNVAGTDRNTVLHPTLLGAWWPAGSPYASGKAPAPAKPKPAPHPAQKGGTYIVRSGDTLTKIAAGHHTTVAKLASLNHIGNVDVIRVGQRLALPGSTPAKKPAKKAPAHTVVVTVHKGDTLSAIAKRHHTTWPKVATLNHLKNPNLIRIGQRLRVPA